MGLTSVNWCLAHKSLLKSNKRLHYFQLYLFLFIYFSHVITGSNYLMTWPYHSQQIHNLNYLLSCFPWERGVWLAVDGPLVFVFLLLCVMTLTSIFLIGCVFKSTNWSNQIHQTLEKREVTPQDPKTPVVTVFSSVLKPNLHQCCQHCTPSGTSLCRPNERNLNQ